MTDGNSSLPPNPPPVSSWMTRAWTELIFSARFSALWT